MEGKAKGEISIRIDGGGHPAEAQLGRAVQRSVLTEIAQLDLHQGGSTIRIPEDWIGIVLHNLREIEGLLED